MSDFESKEKFVEFHEYCNKCKHKDKSPTADPCDECLGVPVRFGTRKPVKFEEREGKN